MGIEQTILVGISTIGAICLFVFVILYCIFEWRTVLEWVFSLGAVVIIMGTIFGLIGGFFYLVGSGVTKLGLF